MSKERTIQKYKTLLSTMLSDNDMKAYLGQEAGDKILKYSELEDYGDLDELLPEKNDYRIILTETKRNSGHWCCILRYNDKGVDTVEWFDSYSGKPDSELKFIPTAIKNMLGENKHHLTRLVKNTGGSRVIYNKKRFQELNDGVDTCGRWTVARIMTAKLGYNLEDFAKKLDKISTETGKPYDIIVCDWVQ